MPETHTIGIPLQDGHRTTAMFSILPAKKLLVFVHGFSGEAQGTWKNIPSRLMSDAAFDEVDVIFFGYKSKRQATVSAGELYTLLSKVLGPEAKDLYPAAMKERGETIYENVVLVCHSLGAVVTRRAMLTAISKQKLWREKVKLLLFAPAHNGCDLVSLLVTCLPGPSKLLAFFTQYNLPVLRDLTPGSDVLKRLSKESKKVILSGSDRNSVVAHEIIWAENEKVVVQGQFCEDPVEDIVAYGQGHVSVCKPTAKYLLPMERLIAAL